MDPNYANAFFDVGRCLYKLAEDVIDNNPNATTKDLIPKLKPIYDEAIPFLKKAISLDPENNKPQSIIDAILYKFEMMGIKADI